MITNIGNQMKIKLKASIEEFVGPILKRMLASKGTAEEEIIADIQILIEKTKGVVESRQKWNRELIGIFGEIERKFECYEENNRAHDEHTSSMEEESLEQASSKKEERGEDTWVVVRENLKNLFETTGIYSSMVSTNIPQKEESKLSTYEVGAPSNSNNEEYYPEVGLADCRRGLSTQQTIWLDSLGIFPLYEKLKKRLLVYYWIGLEVVPSRRNVNTTNANQVQRCMVSIKSFLRSWHAKSKKIPKVDKGTNLRVERNDLEKRLHAQQHWSVLAASLKVVFPKLKKIGAGSTVSDHTFENELSNTIAEQRAENFFDYLVQKGLLKTIHIREHNQIIDQCTIKSSIHRRLRAAFLWKRLRNALKNAKRGTNRHMDNNGSSNVRLNVNQKYLNSKDIVGNVLGDNVQVVHFGRWRSIDLNTRDRGTNIAFEETKSQDHIEVDETKFLKKLGENVTYLSLRGISRIDKLPKSIGKLGDMRILDLRACHNLEVLPEKPQSISLNWKSHQGYWFNKLTHLDISECYLLVHMPKWICELSHLTVLKGFVAVNKGKHTHFCRLSDLSKLKKLRKLSIRIPKHLDPEDVTGLESLDWLSVLTVTWSINEDNNDSDKVQTISFPKNLEKLDIRCYPKAEAAELLNPSVLPKLKRLYIRGGKLVKIANSSNWIVEILRLRFLNDLEIDGYELNHTFTMLEYVEFKKCPSLKNFPKNRSAWNTKTYGPFPDGPEVKIITDHTMPVEVKNVSNNWAPLARNNQKMMLELTGPTSITNRRRLNIVAVLDVSGSMKGEKIEKMKIAMLFVIRKLRAVDRLSIVIFSTNARMIWPLQHINGRNRRKLERKVKKLMAFGSTNMFAGLQKGLNILKDAEISSDQGTVGSIILMSDGEQTYGDTAIIPVGHVAVHTFGFGERHDPMVLKTIAYNSMGGTFSDVVNTDNLIKAFSVCLAGLLTVVVQDLTLTLTPIKEASTIELVSAGDYMQLKDNDVGPITIKFGDLYSGEVRKVLLHLLLPAVNAQGVAHVLEVSHSFKLSGILVEAKPVIIDVRRMQTVSAYKQQAPPEVIAEETRLNTVKMMTEAIALANDTELETAREKISNAMNFLEDVKRNMYGTNELFGLLSAELEELLKIMESEEIYTLKGAFAYSLLISHDRQRMAARGDDIEKYLSFATPFMLKFLKQAEEFAEDPRRSLTSVDEDAQRMSLTSIEEEVNFSAV